MDPSPPRPAPFPSLPIVTPDPPRRSQQEKYGLLWYLAIAVLAVLVVLIGWFGHRAWTMRDVWTRIYRLADREQSAEVRIRSAFELAADPRVEPAQLWELCLRRDLPDLARYVAAAGIGPEYVASDPAGYVSAVARSESWPSWLRMALTPPLALAAAEGHAISRERLGELCRRDDPILRLWALYALAVQPRPDPQTREEIERAAHSDGPERGLAEMLLRAFDDPPNARAGVLREAVEWTRGHHPETVAVWSGWALENGRLVRRPARAAAAAAEPRPANP